MGAPARRAGRPRAQHIGSSAVIETRSSSSWRRHQHHLRRSRLAGSPAGPCSRPGARGGACPRRCRPILGAPGSELGEMDREPACRCRSARNRRAGKVSNAVPGVYADGLPSAGLKEKPGQVRRYNPGRPKSRACNAKTALTIRRASPDQAGGASLGSATMSQNARKRSSRRSDGFPATRRHSARRSTCRPADPARVPPLRAPYRRRPGMRRGPRRR